MALEVVFKRRFTNRLVSVLGFLEKEWGLNAAADFLSKIDERIESLKSHPYIGAPVAGKQDIRGLHITKHNKLYYKIDGNKLIVLNLYDTRKSTYQ